jgi:sulfite reductase alpha subunit
VASIARADCSVIGTWKDEIQVDAKQVQAYAKNGTDIETEICEMCPTGCMAWDGKKLEINDAECVKCMHCINVMPKALKPGKERGATILVGSKAPIIGGALLSSVMVPFLEMKAPYEDLKELTEAIWDLWGEHGKNRERVGEFIQRVGLGNFLDEIGLEPIPEMVAHPRTNPYIFFEDELEGDDE